MSTDDTARLAGRYTLERRIGFSPGLEVFLARRPVSSDDPRPCLLRRPVAGSDPAVAAALHEEARIGLRLEHPNVVRVLDYLQIDGVPCLITEVVEGASLAHLMHALARRGRWIPSSVAWQIAEAIARGLAHVHGQGFAHGDLGPEAVLLGRQGEVLIHGFRGGRREQPSDVQGLGRLFIELLSGLPIDQGFEQVAAELVALGNTDLARIGGDRPPRAAKLPSIFAAGAPAGPGLGVFGPAVFDHVAKATPLGVAAGEDDPTVDLPSPAIRADDWDRPRPATPAPATTDLELRFMDDANAGEPAPDTSPSPPPVEPPPQPRAPMLAQGAASLSLDLGEPARPPASPKSDASEAYTGPRGALGRRSGTPFNATSPAIRWVAAAAAVGVVAMIALVVVRGSARPTAPTTHAEVVPPKVPVPADRSLDPKALAIRLVTDPPGASVSVDGRPLLGATPLTLPARSIGEVLEVQVELTGYMTARHAIEIAEGAEPEQTIRLVPARSIDVTSDPVGAKVWVDGTAVGVTPRLGLGAPSDRPWRLKVELVGFRTFHKRVRPGRSVHAQLSPRPLTELPLTRSERAAARKLWRAYRDVKLSLRRVETVLDGAQADLRKLEKQRQVFVAPIANAQNKVDDFERKRESLQERIAELEHSMEVLRGDVVERLRAEDEV